MDNPYHLLGVTKDASDDDIKRAYLQHAKTHSPEHDPEWFQRIRNAYEMIKDQRSRLAYALFTPSQTDFTALLEIGLQVPQPPRPTPEQFDKLLRASFDAAQWYQSTQSTMEQT